jgi:bifunctional DNase/RNase
MGGLNNVKWCLIGCLIVVLVLMVGSVFIPNRLTAMVDWVANSDFAGKLREPPPQEVHQENVMTEMVVEAIAVSEIDYQPIVILKEKDGELYLPIWIGLLEASAISVVLEGIDMPRPLTADLLCSIIERMGAKVEYIVINDFQDNTFYANIALHANWTQMEIDARPSDAIAIALRVRTPIYATEAVLERAGVPPDQKTDKYTAIYLGESKPESDYEY